jgi:hypothetical protein
MSEFTPKYKRGDILRHRTSGERAVVSHVMPCGDDENDVSYCVDGGIGKAVSIRGSDIGVIWEPVEDEP